MLSERAEDLSCQWCCSPLDQATTAAPHWYCPAQNSTAPLSHNINISDETCGFLVWSRTDAHFEPQYLDRNGQTLFTIALLSVCLQKWKRLSRLQRSLILLFLFMCGIASYPAVTEHLRGKTLIYSTYPTSLSNCMLSASCKGASRLQSIKVYL